jgi:two-component system osmolarity sensor histidine kinase EnvZ|tara:strand:+ start:3430 stop:4761 length:1332 start_codon:yes stop_codon:yes gene_type:complete
MKIDIPIFKKLKKISPNSLYTRSLIIIIAPIVVLQAILTFVFLERHWQLVTKKLSSSVVSEIGMIIKMQKETDQETISSYAKEFYDISINYYSNQEISLDNNIPKTIVERTLVREIGERLDTKTWVQDFPEEKKVKVIIPLGSSIIEFLIPRRNVYATNSHIFLVWMVISSILILSIAILFLRQQIKPIEKLAKAAESFGMGKKIENFKPSGASEVRKAADAYIKMQERIEKFIEQRTLMLAGVSHDLRTPLTRIKLQLEMLSKNRENEELLKDVDEMQYMLETYLDFSQTVSSEESSLVNINKLIEEVIETSKDENNFIIFKPLKKNEINHKCKYIALKRCIINIINNAKAYGDKIIIKLSESDYEININIEDNGPGISEKDYQKALKPFQRLDSSRNQNIAGSGLGLSISQDIIKTLNGNLNLSKSEMGGLKVEINLPKIS